MDLRAGRPRSVAKLRFNLRDGCLKLGGMNIQVAVLCDAATNDNEKLNLLGAFDTIYAAQMPAVHPQCAVALRVTFQADDEGEQKFSLNFINADGRPIMQGIELPVTVTLPGDAHFLTRNFIVNIQQLKFTEPGLYSVDVRLDDRSEASIPLLVKLMPPGGGGGVTNPLNEPGASGQR